MMNKKRTKFFYHNEELRFIPLNSLIIPSNPFSNLNLILLLVSLIFAILWVYEKYFV